MSRIEKLMSQKSGGLLNIFFTAGFPELNSTLPLMEALEAAGADMIELGIPYSDPLADGPVIQESSVAALENGMSIAILFDQLKTMRPRITLPVILMGYFNPVLQYGFEAFCRDAAAAGVEGLILPDLPVEEYEREYLEIVKNYGLDFIFLVTPETPEKRVRLLDSLSSGFLYAVASSSVTGSDQDQSKVSDYLQRLASLKLKNPILAGFGLKQKEDFDLVCQYARGGIIGSEFVRMLAKPDFAISKVRPFINGILGQ